jgi:NodT family efflux transporter outer membrane factor (OMF) lipoprotein
MAPPRRQVRKRSPRRRFAAGVKARGKAFLALLLVFLTGLQPGCTSMREYVGNGFKVGPNYRRPPAPVAGAWIDMDDPRIKSDPPADCAWWAVFNDPVLDSLIDQAYRQNLDLRSAGTRIVEARARRSIAVGSLFPQQQTADITYLHAQISQFNLWAAGFNGSWELDIWGRYRRSIEAADAVLQQSVEGYGEVLVLLLSDVAANYIELRTFQQRLAYAQMNVEIQKGSLKLAEARFSRGASTELDVRQARSSLQRTQAVVPTYEASAREAANALCVLLGMPPSDLATALGPAPIPTAPPEVALGVPADLLARRPDVRRAERAVAEQSARLGIATTDLYPSLTLNGYLGFLSDDIDKLFESTSFTGYIIPRFSWNVLNYGRIANNIVAQDARLQGVAFDYQQTVLKAGKEVEDSLTRFLHAQQRAKFLRGSVDDAKRAVELAELQFKGGTTDFNRVYNLQSLLAQQQDELAAVEGSIALNLVAVYKSLGGGWRCFLYCNGMPAPSHELLPAEEFNPETIQGTEPLPPPLPTPPMAASPKSQSPAPPSAATTPSVDAPAAVASRPSSRRVKTAQPLAAQPLLPIGSPRPLDPTPQIAAKPQSELRQLGRVPTPRPQAEATQAREHISEEPVAATPKQRPRIGLGALFARLPHREREPAANTAAAEPGTAPLAPPIPAPPVVANKVMDPRPSSRRVVRGEERVAARPQVLPDERKVPSQLPSESPLPVTGGPVTNRPTEAPSPLVMPSATPTAIPKRTTNAAAADPRPSKRRVISAEERLSRQPRPDLDQREAFNRSPQSAPKATVVDHDARLASQAGHENGVGLVERH